MNELTPRQSDVLEAIKGYIAKVGFPPTVSEIAGLMGWASPNAAAEHVNALKRKGYITVARGAARGIALVEDGNEQDAVSIIRSLLDGDEYARDHAILWLESRGVKL